MNDYPTERYPLPMECPECGRTMRPVHKHRLPDLPQYYFCTFCDAMIPENHPGIRFREPFKVRVRDILPPTPIEKIEVRTNYPDHLRNLTPNQEEWGMLFGYCSWDGNELKSLDGDNYYLDEEITGFRWWNGLLTYWIHSEYEHG